MAQVSQIAVNRTRKVIAEVFVTYNDPIATTDGTVFQARACGREMNDGRWEGWIEFESIDGMEVLRSGRETTQPNRDDAAYWATGLTPVYLEGALTRAREPRVAVAPVPQPRPAFDGPRHDGHLPPLDETEPLPESVLNPFSVYRKGEGVLRNQLSALAAWHLVNIVQAYDLSDQPTPTLERTAAPQLVELIVAEVRRLSQA
jgi:hypothetical protein